MYYICKTLSDGKCIEYVEYTGFFAQFSQLTFAQANELLALTALLFLKAWLWSFLSKQAQR